MDLESSKKFIELTKTIESLDVFVNPFLENPDQNKHNNSIEWGRLHHVRKNIFHKVKYLYYNFRAPWGGSGGTRQECFIELDDKLRNDIRVVILKRIADIKDELEVLTTKC